MIDPRLLPSLLAALLLGTAVSSADTPATIKAAEAKDHAGKRVTACGKVVEVQKAIYNAGRSWVLNLDDPAPRAPLAIYVPGNTIDNYFWNADKRYLNRDICATGLIRDRDGLLYMQILRPSDLEIVKAESSR